jgi:hypothetical protein
VTDHDRQLEQQLRAQAKVSQKAGRQAAARVLADFYEERGQPSRAELWRDERRLHGGVWHAADLIKGDSSHRRQVMMWLLGHVISKAEIARLFRFSPSWTQVLIKEIEAEICSAANWARHHPTKATERLQAVGALPPRFDRGTFELGEEPPQTWPITREEEARRASTTHRFVAPSIDAKKDVP